jgi:hypothetical protein
MEIIEKLKLDVRKYLHLRKIFRTIEFVCLAALFIVFLFSGGTDLIEIIGCFAAVSITLESLLAVQRNGIEITIRNGNLIANDDLEFYSKMKTEFEKFRQEFISKGSEKFISDGCQLLVIKEETGTGWLSMKIKEFEDKCNKAEQMIKNLKSIKRLVVF